jgi:hypothetical protein
MIREEFKLIMQVVFSLSRHGLKTELQDSSDMPKRGSKKKGQTLVPNEIRANIWF